MEVVPVNIYERMFTICTMFTALVFFSSFVSSITNEVASMRLKRRAQTTNSSKLIRFLQENNISLGLGAQIQDVALAQQKTQTKITKIHESDVELLSYLPVSLKEELHVEVYYSIIALNPFLDRLGELAFQAITSLCHAAMHQQSLMVGQEFFGRGKDGTHVLFVIAGEVKYWHGIHTALEMRGTPETATVQKEQYLCEQILFLHWRHQGLLTARMPCELATLEGIAFHQIVRRFPQTLAFCKKFTRAYVDMLMVSEEELTDLPLGTQAMKELVDRTNDIHRFNSESSSIPSEPIRPRTP